MHKFILLPNTIRRIKAGERLVHLDDIEASHKAEQINEGTEIQLFDEENQFLAKALVGRQNKGFAWVFTTDQETVWNKNFITQSIEMALGQRRNYFTSSETTAFRLFNGEGDGIGGITIDWYDGYLQFNWYSRGIYAYREWFTQSLTDALPEAKGMYETKRFKTDDQEAAIEHTYGQQAPQPLIIQENAVNYAVYLGEDWMTGIFLDQREVRQFIQTQAANQSVLNLFSYTGAFSVAAAVGGARHTISVDVAKRSRERTNDNFELNQIKPDKEQHEIRVMDVFDYIQYAKRHDLQFDLVVCDPPSFARTKQYQFQAEQDYQSLARDLFELTAPGGMTVLSTNHSAYSKESFQQDLIEATDQVEGIFHLIQSYNLPDDFPTSQDATSQYLKVLVFYREQ